MIGGSHSTHRTLRYAMNELGYKIKRDNEKIMEKERKKNYRSVSSPRVNVSLRRADVAQEVLPALGGDLHLPTSRGVVSVGGDEDSWPPLLLLRRAVPIVIDSDFMLARRRRTTERARHEQANLHHARPSAALRGAVQLVQTARHGPKGRQTSKADREHGLG